MFWAEKGATFERYSKLALKSACEAYGQWGSLRMVDILEERMKHLLSAHGSAFTIEVFDSSDKTVKISGGTDPQLKRRSSRGRRVSKHGNNAAEPPIGSSNTNMNRLKSGSAVSLLSSNNLDIFTILKATQSLSTEASLEKLISDLMHHLATNAGADAGMLILKHQDSRQFLQQAQFSYADAVETMHVLQGASIGSLDEPSAKAPNSILAHVFKTQRSILLSEPYPAPHSHDVYLRDDAPKSLMCVPLMQKGRLLGMIYLANHVLANAFTPDRLEIIQSIGMSASMAFENARLARANADLETALQITSNDTKDDESVPKYTFDGPIQKATGLLSSIRKKHPEVEADVKFVMGLLISGKSVFASNLESIRDQSGQGIDNDMKDWLRDTIMQPNYISVENKQLISPKHDALAIPARRDRRLSAVTMNHLMSSRSTKSSEVDCTRMERVLASCMTMNFDIFELYDATGGCPITILGPHMIIHTEKLAEYFQMDSKKIRNYFAAIDQGYRDNPYHNSKHGADVVRFS